MRLPKTHKMRSEPSNTYMDSLLILFDCLLVKVTSDALGTSTKSAAGNMLVLNRPQALQHSARRDARPKYVLCSRAFVDVREWLPPRDAHHMESLIHGEGNAPDALTIRMATVPLGRLLPEPQQH